MATRTPNRSSSQGSRSRSRSSSGGNGNNSNGDRSRSTSSSSNGERTRSSSGSNTNSSRGRSSNGNNRSAFSWSDNAPALIGAAVAGAAIGLAANFGRKFATQAMSGMAGDWDEVLATEHDMTIAIFDKMLATDSSQTWKRGMLLMQLTHALDKHAHEEEMVIYPALREANETVDADHLTEEHGYVKTFLYELNQMGADHRGWLDKVREFRTFISQHMKMEEEQVFPRFKQALSEDQNANITSLVNRDGFWQA
jgi:hemerythrin superfamily protein